MEGNLYMKKQSKNNVQSCILVQNSLNFIVDMLLYDKVRIKNVPRELRVFNTSLYITALRISRGLSQERYMEDINLLKSDIPYVNKRKTRNFIALYESSLNFSPQKIKYKE